MTKIADSVHLTVVAATILQENVINANLVSHYTMKGAIQDAYLNQQLVYVLFHIAIHAILLQTLHV